jgi:E3 ubiquitin-protein ligase RNF115/126
VQHIQSSRTDATQIEEEHDPRDSHMFDAEDDDDVFPAMMMGAPPPMYPHHDHPPQTDDPEEADISNFHFARVGPGRFNVQATITRSVSPQELNDATAPGSIAGFMSMLNGLTRAAGQPQGQPQGQGRGQGEGLFTGAGGEAQGQGQEGTQPQVHTGRFTYHGGARLTPRTDGPGMRVEPVDDISK